MKVALVYDRVNKWGGAEKVLLALHKLFPDAPLYTSVYDPQKAPWALRFNSGQAKIKTSFLQKITLASSNHELFATLMPIAFESFSFDEYDLVISVTSEAAKGIITKPGTKHVCYCLTPTRYLWSGYNDYFKDPLLKFISKPVVSYLRNWDRIVAQRPDKIIAISKEVQERVKKYYKRESEVVYPPVGIDNNFARQPRVSDDARLQNSENQPVNSASLSKIRHQSETKPNFSSPESRSACYFLIVSRLVPYKKIDLAVGAFNRLRLPLKIIGIGSEMGRLKAIANSNIEFLGNLTDKELVEYYNGCRALIFPGLEDFGLTILEAQSFGKPVIAFRAGGALETVIENKTGVFFDQQSVESLGLAIKQFNNPPGGEASMTINPKDCTENARKFSFERFKKEFMEVINNIAI